MKKQFTKIKIAAENLSRSNKSDCKDFELETIEKQVDKYRDVLEKMVRKLPAVSGGGTTTDPQERDKRIKKNAHYKIGQALEESADELYKELPLHHVLANCGDLEKSIAECIVDSELETETEVVRRLKLILDNEIQKISTLKRNVSRTVQEYTSLKRNYEAAIRLDEPQAKINNIKEQQEQCEVKLEKERDLWAAQMFELISREDEIVHCIRDYVLNQRNYYERTLYKVNKSLARIQDIIQSTEKTRFDANLCENLKSTNRQISYILELCVCCLLESGLTEEGLLRVGCTKTKLRRMKHALEAQYLKTPLPAEYQDPHVIASLLKDYLRVMPEPLLTYRLYKDFISAVDHSTEDERKAAIKATLAKLPEENYANLRYLCKFLWHVTQHADKNKMNSQNLAIVMSPNMLRARIDKSSGAADYLNQVNTSSAVNVIVELLISRWDYFFEGEVEFYVTLQRNKLFAEGGRFLNNKSNSSNENLDKHEPDGSLDSPRYGTIRRQKAYAAPSPPSKATAENKTSNNNGNNNEKTFAIVAPSTGVALGVGINTESNAPALKNGDVSRGKELFPATGNEKPEKPPLPKVLQLQQKSQTQQLQEQNATPKPVPMTRTQFFGLDNLPSPTVDRKSSDSTESKNSLILKPDLPQKPKIPKRPAVLSLSGNLNSVNKSDDDENVELPQTQQQPQQQQQTQQEQEIVERKSSKTMDDLKHNTEKLIEMLSKDNCDNIASQLSAKTITTTTAATETTTTTTNTSSVVNENNENTNHFLDQERLNSDINASSTSQNSTASTASTAAVAAATTTTTTASTTKANTVVTTVQRQTPTTPVSPNMIQTPKRPTCPAPPPPTTPANRKSTVQ